MEENKNSTKNTQPAKREKKPNIFVRFGRFIKNFFRDYRSEMKKVTWMNARDVRKSTILVTAAVIAVSLVTLGVDTLFTFIITLLGGLI